MLDVQVDLRRCAQCWKWKAFPEAFMGRRGKPIKRCTACTAKYGDWAKLSLEQRVTSTSRRPSPGAHGRLRAELFLDSGNRKLGSIPVSITSGETCPRSCSFYGRGCYAEFHYTRRNWDRVGRSGRFWAEFVAAVDALPRGQLWRHNEAGDLPGIGEAIDAPRFGALVRANAGKRGFTFTHKPVLSGRCAPGNRVLIREANVRGFVVNLSADSLREADAMAELGIAPVAVVLAEGVRETALRTPAGRMVTVCPADTVGLTCAECQLCARAYRKTIVGFRAHGQARALVTELVRRRRRPTTLAAP